MTHHREALRRLTEDDALATQLKEDCTRASLGDADRTMLDYVAKLTREPWTVSEGDLFALRGVGFEDRALPDIVQITAYFAFVTRVADGWASNWRTTGEEHLTGPVGLLDEP
jgi:uncharacterized peroxidase-related enzyme